MDYPGAELCDGVRIAAAFYGCRQGLASGDEISVLQSVANAFGLLRRDTGVYNIAVIHYVHSCIRLYGCVYGVA